MPLRSLYLVLAIFVCLSPLTQPQCPEEFDPQEGVSWYYTSNFDIANTTVEVGASFDGMNYVGGNNISDTMYGASIIIPNHGYSHYAFKGAAYNMTEFDVLTYRPGYRYSWVTYRGGDFPKGALAVGRNENLNETWYVGRIWIGETLSVCNINPYTKKGYFPDTVHGFIELITSYFDVLVVLPEACYCSSKSEL